MPTIPEKSLKLDEIVSEKSPGKFIMQRSVYDELILPG